MEVRVTNWLPYHHFGYEKYRIWKRVSDGVWHQRHEWVRKDGATEVGSWIGSFPEFIDGMKFATELDHVDS